MSLQSNTRALTGAASTMFSTGTAWNPRQVGESRGRLKHGNRTVGLDNEHSSHVTGRGPVTLEEEASRWLPGLETLESDPLINACTEPERAAYEHRPRRPDGYSSIGTQIRVRCRAGRLEAIRYVFEGIGADRAETRRAVAIVSLLASADAGIVLADQYGLTLGEAGRACAETTRAITKSPVSDLFICT